MGKTLTGCCCGGTCTSPNDGCSYICTSGTWVWDTPDGCEPGDDPTTCGDPPDCAKGPGCNTTCRCLEPTTPCTPELEGQVGEGPGCECVPAASGPRRKPPLRSPSRKEAAMRPSQRVQRWRRFGRPTRTADEAAELYNTYCANPDDPCEHLTIVGGCSRCGCKGRRSKQSVINRLLWATEGCPADPPRFPAKVSDKPPHHRRRRSSRRKRR